MKYGNTKKQVSGSRGDSGRGAGAHGLRDSKSCNKPIRTRNAGAGGAKAVSGTKRR